MAKLSAGQKRRQKELKRKKKQQLKKQLGNVAYMGSAPSLPKLSERLIEFAGDILDNPHANQHFMENAIGFAVMCWNMGVVTAEKSREMRATAAQVLGEDVGYLPEEIEDQIDLLVTKKRFLYKDDPRLIAEYSVNWGLGSQYHIQVKSLVLPDDERFVPSLENSSMGMSDKTRTALSVMETPLTEQEKQLEQMISDGFSFLRKKSTPDGKDSSVAACEVWLEAWGMIKTLYGHQSSLNDINNRLSFALNIWSDDIDMHLRNAAHDDASLIEKGIIFFQEFCDHFPDAHEVTHLNMRRTIAELQLMKGDIEQGEATFETLVNDLPDQAWGYIGWGDIYNPVYRSTFNVPVDTDRARRLYRIPIVRELEHASDARERLDELLAYERESATILDASAF